MLGHDERGPIVGRVRLRMFEFVANSAPLPIFAFEAEAAELLAPELGLARADSLPLDGGPIVDGLRIELGPADFVVVLGAVEWTERHHVLEENVPWLGVARAEGRALFLLGPRGFAHDDATLQASMLSGRSWGGFVLVASRG